MSEMIVNYELLMGSEKETRLRAESKMSGREPASIAGTRLTAITLGNLVSKGVLFEGAYQDAEADSNLPRITAIFSTISGSIFHKLSQPCELDYEDKIAKIKQFFKDARECSDEEQFKNWWIELY